MFNPIFHGKKIKIFFNPSFILLLKHIFLGQVFSVSVFVHNDNQRAQEGLFLKVLDKGFESLNLSFNENFGAKVAQIGKQQKIDKW